MDFESVAGDLTSINQSGISTVSNLCKQQIALEKRIADLELELKDAKREHRKVAEDLLPAALQEYGVTELKMEDGSEITVAPYYSASIAKDRQDEAFRWLTEAGHGSLIKNHVTAAFGRGEDNSAKDLLAELEQRGLQTQTKTWVEPMTLKSFVKEQVEKGENLPYDLLGIFVGQRAKIRR
jgi:hypothetical protein|tara:strand:+ start:721 stop:1263 length:543 start_codon:yes stop_codon:yes gene_type:complete